MTLGKIAKESESKDISGWIVLFLFSLLIVNPIILIIEFATSFVESASKSFFEIYGFIEIFGMIGLSVCAGIFLLIKTHYAVKFAKTLLITTFVLGLINSILYFVFDDLWGSFIYFIVWTLYLYNSKKVKAIYSDIKHPKKGVSVWSNLAIVYAFLAPIFGIIFSIYSFSDMNRYRSLKGKGRSITALVISIVITLFIFAYPLIVDPDVEFEKELERIDKITDYNEFIQIYEMACSDYCYDEDYAEQYYLEETEKKDTFTCYCLDAYDDVVSYRTISPYKVDVFRKELLSYRCGEFCNEIQGTTSYNIEHYNENLPPKSVCSCLDDYNAIITKEEFFHKDIN
jgi:hypothetical protein